MKQRSLDASGDYSFGRGLPFLQSSPLCVAQAIMTRLRLRTNEWFVDLTDGTDYDGQILGHNTGATRDQAIRIRILDTPGVKQINKYISVLDQNRAFTVAAIVDTIYGPVSITTIL